MRIINQPYFYFYFLLLLLKYTLDNIHFRMNRGTDWSTGRGRRVKQASVELMSDELL